MRTAFLMTALTVLLVLVGDYFGGARGMMMMLIISLAMNLFRTGTAINWFWHSIMPNRLMKKVRLLYIKWCSVGGKR